MAEEHSCQAPRLCENNCGFFGSPATQNLCSKCHLDLQFKVQQSSNAKLALSQTLTATASQISPSSSSSATAASVSNYYPTFVDMPEVSSDVAPAAVVILEKEETQALPPSLPKRCLTCRKRVGLTGFKCRCGMVFCGVHRYPEHHGCAFDFKTMGKEQIAKANPIVKADKLEKI